MSRREMRGFVAAVGLVATLVGGLIVATNFLWFLEAAPYGGLEEMKAGLRVGQEEILLATARGEDIPRLVRGRQWAIAKIAPSMTLEWSVVGVILVVFGGAIAPRWWRTIREAFPEST